MGEYITRADTGGNGCEAAGTSTSRGSRIVECDGPYYRHCHCAGTARGHWRNGDTPEI